MSVSTFCVGPKNVPNLPGVVTLSGQTVSSTSLGTAIAGVRFNTDGTVDQNKGGFYTQIDSSTDWIIPNGGASSDFDVRLVSVTGAALDTGPATGTWVNLGTNREWLQIRSTNGTDSSTCVFAIRYKGGGDLDTGTYTLTAIKTI